MCGSVCFCLYKAPAHCVCCEAMHACVGVCVWVCTRRMLTFLAARRCMPCVGVCVWAYARRMLTVILLRGDACLCQSFLFGSCARRMVTVIGAG
jgi:hypothetical protein